MSLRTFITVVILMLFIGLMLGVGINHALNPQPVTPVVDVNPGRSIRVASWNLQVFGMEKASNATIRQFVASKIRESDIFVAQEIKDESGDAVKLLWGEVKSDFDVALSQRAGTTSSKEQYAIFYRRSLVSPIRTNDLSLSDVYYRYWERPPFEVTFKSQNYSFTLVTLHAKPTNAENETHQLEWITSTLSGDVMVIGDMNLACDYARDASTKFFLNWTWEIPDDADTTSGATNCAYDRIIVNPSMKSHVSQAGIDTATNFSDHYEIFTVVNP